MASKKNKQGWTKYKQYSTPDVLRRQAKMFWNFGVSREIRYELNIDRLHGAAIERGARARHVTI